MGALSKIKSRIPMVLSSTRPGGSDVGRVMTEPGRPIADAGSVVAMPVIPKISNGAGTLASIKNSLTQQLSSMDAVTGGQPAASWSAPTGSVGLSALSDLKSKLEPLIAEVIKQQSSAAAGGGQEVAIGTGGDGGSTATGGGGRSLIDPGSAMVEGAVALNDVTDVMSLYEGYLSKFNAPDYGNLAETLYRNSKSQLDQSYESQKRALDAELRRRGLYSSGIALSRGEGLRRGYLDALSRASDSAAMDVEKLKSDALQRARQQAMDLAKAQQSTLSSREAMRVAQEEKAAERRQAETTRQMSVKEKINLLNEQARLQRESQDREFLQNSTMTQEAQLQAILNEMKKKTPGKNPDIGTLLDIFSPLF